MINSSEGIEEEKHVDQLVAEIKDLTGKLGASSGSDKKRLEQAFTNKYWEIERYKKQIDDKYIMAGSKKRRIDTELGFAVSETAEETEQIRSLSQQFKTAKEVTDRYIKCLNKLKWVFYEEGSGSATASGKIAESLNLLNKPIPFVPPIDPSPSKFKISFRLLFYLSLAMIFVMIVLVILNIVSTAMEWNGYNTRAMVIMSSIVGLLALIPFALYCKKSMTK
jgi:hypothetical protein